MCHHMFGSQAKGCIRHREDVRRHNRLTGHPNATKAAAAAATAGKTTAAVANSIEAACGSSNNNITNT